MNKRQTKMYAMIVKMAGGNADVLRGMLSAAVRANDLPASVLTPAQ